MAYISKETVQAKQVKLAKLNKEYGVSARFSGSGTSSLYLTVTAGKMDFISNFLQNLKESNSDLRQYSIDPESFAKSLTDSQYMQCNHYYLDRQFSGKCLEYLHKAYQIMLEGHFDKSEPMVDYFCCAWYNHIQIGRWNKPYILKEGK